ncbi:Imm63 family immunity protein [Streptomyces sp. HUAS TT7]|uniref:Imm63 family immunity protein n=1 Tax=Streptomyces sp. HUAS TT7 TaxID=3447507 RepID=UPI003F65DFF4
MTITKAEMVAASREVSLALYGRPDAELLVDFEPRESYPYIEIRDGVVHVIVRECGKELPHAIYENIDDIMFMIAETETSSLARSWESEHRVELAEDKERDSRIPLVAKQLQLLNRVSPVWAERLRAIIARPDRYSGITLEQVDAYRVK